jgi:hypothetical protein
MPGQGISGLTTIQHVDHVGFGVASIFPRNIADITGLKDGWFWIDQIL